VVDLPEKEVKELRLLDNKIAEKNEWDMDTLAIEMREVNSPLISEVFSFELNTDFLDETMHIQDVTKESLNKTQDKLDSFVDDKTAKTDSKTSVICPHCYEEFYIENR
jgi:hypothetical protein